MNQYYDAESGEDEDEGSDTSSYSSSDSYNLHSAIEDYESGLSSTDDGTQSAADLADLGPMEDLNLEDSLEESLEDSMDFQSFQASAILLEEKSITRRTKLPYPTISMENINFMSILRNNVSCDYSYLF
jgi:hypothetical protein